MYTYHWNAPISKAQLVKLYDSVEWTAYTQNPDKLELAIKQSLSTLSAWQGGTLVGLIRVVGDDATILYIQDILVIPAHQRQGIGTYLMHEVMKRYEHVRQKTLITDMTDKTCRFYESCGFVALGSLDAVSYYRDELMMPPLEL